MNHQAELYESFWHDKDHEDQWEMVGLWAERFPWQYDESFALYSDILKTNGVDAKNVWGLLENQQKAFLKFIEDTSDGWKSFRDSAFQDYLQELEGRGWDAHDNE